MSDDAAHPRFSDAEFASHASHRQIMESSSLQAVLISGNRAAHTEIQYLTNYAVAFEGTLLFPAKGEMVLDHEWRGEAAPGAARVHSMRLTR